MVGNAGSHIFIDLSSTAAAFSSRSGKSWSLPGSRAASHLPSGPESSPRDGRAEDSGGAAGTNPASVRAARAPGEHPGGSVTPWCLGSEARAEEPRLGPDSDETPVAPNGPARIRLG